jgi:hypothetical protein
MSKTTTKPAPTVVELTAQHDDLSRQVNEAGREYDQLRLRRLNLGGWSVLGTTSPGEVDEADKAAASAERKWEDLQAALSIEEGQPEEAREREEAARLVMASKAGEEARTLQSAALLRLQRAMADADGALEAYDQAQAAMADAANSLREGHARTLAAIKADGQDPSQSGRTGVAQGREGRRCQARRLARGHRNRGGPL